MRSIEDDAHMYMPDSQRIHQTPELRKPGARIYGLSYLSCQRRRWNTKHPLAGLALILAPSIVGTVIIAVGLAAIATATDEHLGAAAGA
jgi:hypothetical protein